MSGSVVMSPHSFDDDTSTFYFFRTKIVRDRNILSIMRLVLPQELQDMVYRYLVDIYYNDIEISNARIGWNLYTLYPLMREVYKSMTEASTSFEEIQESIGHMSTLQTLIEQDASAELMAYSGYEIDTQSGTWAVITGVIAFLLIGHAAHTLHHQEDLPTTELLTSDRLQNIRKDGAAESYPRPICSDHGWACVHSPKGLQPALTSELSQTGYYATDYDRMEHFFQTTIMQMYRYNFLQVTFSIMALDFDEDVFQNLFRQLFVDTAAAVEKFTDSNFRLLFVIEVPEKMELAALHWAIELIPKEWAPLRKETEEKSRLAYAIHTSPGIDYNPDRWFASNDAEREIDSKYPDWWMFQDEFSDESDDSSNDTEA